jgi:hypothetical protein
MTSRSLHHSLLSTTLNNQDDANVVAPELQPQQHVQLPINVCWPSFNNLPLMNFPFATASFTTPFPFDGQQHHLLQQQQQQQLQMMASALPPTSTIDPFMSSSTVVSNSMSSTSASSTAATSLTFNESLSLPEVIVARKSNNDIKSNSMNGNTINRITNNHLPASIIPSNPHTVTHPVPEFLCHLFSMIKDPSNSRIIQWVVPTKNEPDREGGGIKDIGKVVIINPEELQRSVLGQYFRHSQYGSFQRQMNYFMFKKRLHDGMKGKLSPCSYVHEMLGKEPQSLFQLKRRPPVKKRKGGDGAEEDDGSVKKLKSSVTKKTKGNSPVKSTKEGQSTTTANREETKTATTNNSHVSFQRQSFTAADFFTATKQNNKPYVLPNAPLMAQAESFPPRPSIVAHNFAQPMPSCNNSYYSINSPLNQSPLIPSNKTGIRILPYANDVVRQAQKALEDAYLKTKREQQQQDDEEKERNSIDLMIPPPLSKSILIPSVSYQNSACGGSTTETSTSASTKEVIFDSIVSSLLSTTLPPSDELFDEMSSGSHDEDCFNGGALQTLDDGMLLP